MKNLILLFVLLLGSILITHPADAQKLGANGNNAYGQLGDGSTTSTTSTTIIIIGTDSNWVAAGCGDYHSLAIKSNGTLWAWGRNNKGQLGDGTLVDKSSPAQIGLATNWKQAEGGSAFTVAVKTDGTLWAWGDNTKGQLGDGTNIDKTTPVQIGTATNWARVDCGYDYVLAIKTDSTLWAWGDNAYGQLGNNTVTNSNIPIQIGTEHTWWKIATIEGRSLALKTNGTIWQWGTTIIVTIPTQMDTTTNNAGIYAGPELLFARIHTDSTFYSTGAGYYLQGKVCKICNTTLAGSITKAVSIAYPYFASPPTSVPEISCPSGPSYFIVSSSGVVLRIWSCSWPNNPGFSQLTSSLLWDKAVTGAGHLLLLQKSSGIVNPTTPAGTGTSGDPYQIATLDNLNWVTQNTASWAAGKYFIQTADIDASSTNTWDAGAGFSPIGTSVTKFLGSYNGKGHSIDGMVINRPSTNNIGFFGFIGTTGVVDSVGVTNVNFDGQGNVGGLAANSQGSVSNCYSSGTLSTSSSEYNEGAGGLVGSNYGNISYSYSACTVTGDDEIGGFVGINNIGAIIAKCYSTGSVTATGDNAGGFVGIQVAMMGEAEINNCFSRGNVSGAGSVGGFVGKDQMNVGNAYIMKCYSTGSVTGTSNVGGFIGTDWSNANLSNNYFDAETDGIASTVSGTTEGSSNGAIGKTTAEMKTQATFTYWDFTTIWKISSTLNDGYPAFQWAASPSAPMKLKFTTTDDERSIRLPLFGTVNCTVDWGDGSPVESFTTPGRKLHTFATAGTYVVNISDTLTQFGYYDIGNEVGWSGAGYLTEVVDFGNIGLTSLSGAFCDADNLTSVPATLPTTITDLSYCFFLNDKASITNLNSWDVSHVTDMTAAFYEASAFNQNISSWDVSNVTTMEGMFSSAFAFNQPIGTWDVSSVTNMEDLFGSAEAFNQLIGAWDVSSVTTMEGMFESNPAFNQDISTWDVSNVTNMADMFDWATAFNQDISAWDVSSVTDMSWMFIGATAFDQSLADWDISSVTSMEDMFTDVTLSTANYNAMLVAWAAQPVQSNVLFSGGNSKYSCGAPQTSRGVLTGATNSWTITDGGIICIEIGVKQGTTAIADGSGSYDFGGKALSSDTDIEFTIENTGDATSTLGNFTITGADSTQFSFQGVNPDSVVNGSSAAFTVRFSPTSAGAKTATVSFANQDYDENPYTFSITGTGAILATVEYPTGTWTEIQPVGDVDKNWRPLSVSGDGSKMFAGVYQGRLYLSSDGGTNWTETGPTPSGNTNWRYASVSADGSKMASCVWEGRIFLSSDGGTSWSETGPSPLSDKNWASISLSSNGSIMAAVNYSGRLYRSTNGGVNWSESGPAPFADKNWQSVSVSADGSKMVAASVNGRIYKSTDGGTNWSETGPLPLADNFWRTTCVSPDGTTMLAGATRLYMSIDGGTNWSETGPSPLADKSWRTVSLSADGDTMIAAANTGRLYISVDKGTSWSESGPIPFDDKGWTSVVLTLDGSKMFSCAYPGRIYASSNEQLEVTDIAATTATGNGQIANLNGGGDATNRGVIFYPYTDTDKEIDGASVTNSHETGTYGTGAFSRSLAGLSVNTHYNLRAHATNPVGTGYSDRCDFWTLSNVPSPPFAGNATAVSLQVAVKPNGNPATTLFLIQDSVAGLYLQPDGSRTATLTWQTASTWDTITVTGLSTGVTYYFRVKAKNGNDEETAFGLATEQNTCSNPTDGGEIGSDQIVSEGQDTENLTNEAAATGYSGTLEYKWQSSTTSDSEGFEDIAESDSVGFVAGPLNETTWFKRLARVTCKADWTGATESNVLKITVLHIPEVIITAPSDDVTVYENPVTISGTATDADGDLSLVEVKLNGGNWESATGTDSWTVGFDLVPGKNTIQARVSDATNLYSDTASINVLLSIQLISIPQGWSAISSFLTPLNPALPVMMDEITNNDNLVIMLSEYGIYWPPYNTNTIGNWNVEKGYKIKMNQAQEFTVRGDTLPNRSIILSQGYHIIPVLSNTACPIASIFTDPVNDILFMYDVKTSALYWPAGGIYTLSSLEPGKAYISSFKRAVTLTYPVYTGLKTGIINNFTEPPLDGPWPLVRTADVHFVSVKSEAVNKFENVSYIGAFDSFGSCIGYVEIDGRTGNYLLTLYGNDVSPDAKDGADAGEPISFRSFNANTGLETMLMPEFSDQFPDADGLFVSNGQSQIIGFKESSTGFTETGISMQVQIYPNPAKDEVVINLTGFGNLSGFTATLVSTEGKTLKTFPLTGHQTQLDVSDLHPGVYILKLENNENVLIKRLVIQ